MPAVLLELGFINNDEDNRIFDEQFDEMVDAIVRGIEQSIPLTTAPKQYGVQVGLFRYQSNAAYLQEELQDMGYTVQVREGRTLLCRCGGKRTDPGGCSKSPKSVKAAGI